MEAELRLRLDTEAGASPMPTGVTHRALVVEPVGDAVALAELEKYNPLQGRTAEAGGRALRRWVEDLAGDPRTAGLVTKTGGRLYVARAAVLPIGLPSESVTVGEFLATATGELPREVFGVAVPSTLGFQYAHWPERKRQRFLDRLELGKRLDEHNAKCAGLRTTREGRREADRLFCAANAEWAKAHSLAGSARSVREALGKIKAGIDPDAGGGPATMTAPKRASARTRRRFSECNSRARNCAWRRSIGRRSRSPTNTAGRCRRCGACSAGRRPTSRRAFWTITGSGRGSGPRGTPRTSNATRRRSTARINAESATIINSISG